MEKKNDNLLLSNNELAILSKLMSYKVEPTSLRKLWLAYGGRCKQVLLILFFMFLGVLLPALIIEYFEYPHKQFIKAARQGRIEVIQNYLERGLNIDRGGLHNGITALHVAVDNGNRTVVDLLIERGANLDVRDDRNFTPLHKAIFREDLWMVKRLINSGADINFQGWYCDSPLHLASSKGNVQIVEFLIARGADVNSQGEYHSYSYTPLHLASSRGNVQVVKLLIHGGGDVNAITESGKTPLSFAIEKEHEKIVVLLQQHGASK